MLNKTAAIFFDNEESLDDYLNGNNDVNELASGNQVSHNSIPVQHWSLYMGRDETHYYPKKTHQIEVDDQRVTNGQLYVTIASMEGADNETLSATFEVNTLPGTEISCECIHMHFDGDNIAASFFKKGDKIIVRPENGVNILPIALDGGVGYEIS